MTTVVNIEHCPDFDPKRNPNDIYIGRYHPGRPFFPPSRWRNSFKVGQDGTREEVIEKYRQFVVSRPELMAHLHELRGKRLEY